MQPLQNGARGSNGRAQGNEWLRRVSLVYGERGLDESDFDVLDDMPLYGIELDWQRQGAPSGFEAGVFHAEEEESLRPDGRSTWTGTLWHSG